MADASTRAAACRFSFWDRCPGLVLAAAFAAGIAAGEVPAAAGAVASAACAAAAICLGRSRRGAVSPRTRRILWLGTFAGLGALRGAMDRSGRADAESGIVLEGPVEIRGVIDGLAVFRLEEHQADISPLFPGRPGRVVFPLTAAANVPRVRVEVTRCTAEDLALFRWGSTVEVRGKARRTARGAAALNDPGRGAGMVVEATIAQVHVLAGPGPWTFGVALERATEGVYATLASQYSGPAQGLLVSLILGERALLDPRIEADLLTTGTYHFLAISGLNVSLALALFIRLPLFAPLRAPGRLLFLALFAVLSGGQAPVLRAALMLGLHEALGGLGRRPAALNSLGWSAIVLLAAEPRSIADAGFQLSFVAVLAILTWGADLRQHASGAIASDALLSISTRRTLLRRAARAIGASLAISLVSSAATTPLIAYHFHRVHPLAPLWNLAAHALVTIVLAGGYLSAVTGAVLPLAGRWIAAPTGGAADLLAFVIHAAAQVPGSMARVPAPAGWQSIAAAGAALAVFAPAGRRLRMALAAGLLALLVCPPGGDEIVMVQLGARRGGAALVSVPGGDALLLAPATAERFLGRRLAEPVLSTGTARLAAVLLMPQRASAAVAIRDLTRELPIERVYALGSDREGLEAGGTFGDSLRRAGVTCETVACGDVVCLGEGALAAAILLSHPRARSGAISIRITGRRRGREHAVLWLADADDRGLAALLSGRADIGADVVLAAGRWSVRLLLADLVARVRPRTVVLALSPRESEEDLATQLEALGVEVAATATTGTLACVFGPDGVRIEARPRVR